MNGTTNPDFSSLCLVLLGGLHCLTSFPLASSLELSQDSIHMSTPAPLPLLSTFLLATRVSGSRFLHYRISLCSHIFLDRSSCSIINDPRYQRTYILIEFEAELI